MAWPEAHAAEPGQPGDGRAQQHSLFGEILLMLSPLLFLWPISVAVTHHFASRIANQPYDETLATDVRGVAGRIRQEAGRIVIEHPESMRAALHADSYDVVYFQIVDGAGRLLAGDAEIPRARIPDVADPAGVRYHNAYINGEEVRSAYLELPLSGAQRPLLIQVAETNHKRERLAAQIIAGVILPQLAIVPLAVVLVYFGLTRGIAPLHRLQRQISRRRPGDLAPMDLDSVPEEVRPVIASFNELMARLEENLQAQQRFIADAAHQLRTPLTGLKTQTELALNEHDPQHLRLSLQHISASAERAIHLIKQLLLLARTEAGHESLYAFETVDLESLARAVTQEAVPQALAKRIDLGFENSGWPLRIDGNPALLRALMGNLIDNAIKYTPPGGRVTVRSCAASQAVFEVEDNGCGIAEAERERVFERFYRVLGSAADGSGLGLPIVREIAEMHRATVSLHVPSGPPGTLVRVLFPRQAGLGMPSAATPADAGGEGSKRQHSVSMP